MRCVSLFLCCGRSVPVFAVEGKVFTCEVNTVNGEGNIMKLEGNSPIDSHHEEIFFDIEGIFSKLKESISRLKG